MASTSTDDIDNSEYSTRSVTLKSVNLPIGTRPTTIEHAGLDPLHRTFLKLFIRDVLSFREYSIGNDDTSVGFSFQGHLVERVEILGIIVRVDLREYRHAYDLDDGTAVIRCNLKNWENRNQRPQPLKDLPPSLQIKYQEVISAYNTHVEGFELGDLVRVRGGVVLYAGKKEIFIIAITKIEDPNFELERVLALPKLYSACYHKPVKLPTQIAETYLNSEEKSLENLKPLILNHISKNVDSLDNFTIDEILSWSSIASYTAVSTDEHLFRQKLESTLASISETHGVFYRTCNNSDIYQIVKAGCDLSNEVLKIMKTMHKVRTNREKGCHIKDIHDRLKCSSPYSIISAKILERMMACLENESDIVKVDGFRYLLV